MDDGELRLPGLSQRILGASLLGGGEAAFEQEDFQEAAALWERGLAMGANPEVVEPLIARAREADDNR